MPTLLKSTPHADGFYMPSEWATHSRTWMLWPERGDNWRLNAGPAQRAFTEVANAISRFEPVSMGVTPAQNQNARKVLPPNVNVADLPSNDAWIRDCGPTFVVNGKGDVRLVHWKFNAWGGLYTDWSWDELIPPKIADLEGVDYYDAPLILEGGSIHVDGEGTLLTTEECLLNENRNPHLNRQQIENYLVDYTGARKIIWLAKGVYNDETDGHVDNIVCFLRPGMVAITWTDDHNDPQYPISKDAYERLKKSTDAKGRNFEVTKLHQPDPILITAKEAAGVIPVEGTYPRAKGDRMAASYVNFYFCNNAIILPTFNNPLDKQAEEKLQKAFPDRRVVGVYAREILLGGGNIHCITQQQPIG